MGSLPSAAVPVSVIWQDSLSEVLVSEKPLGRRLPRIVTAPVNAGSSRLSGSLISCLAAPRVRLTGAGGSMANNASPAFTPAMLSTPSAHSGGKGTCGSLRRRTAVLTTEARVDPARLAAIRAPFEAFGGEALDAPVLQPLSRLLDVAGEALRARLFVVQSEQAEEQALRPDFTVAAAMEHIRSGTDSGRYRYEGKAFIAADRGSDAPTEFLQIGVEQFGASPDPAAEDAAVVALAWAAAKAGGRADLTLRLGDPGLFAGFLNALGVADAHARRLTRAFGRPGAFRAQLHLAEAAHEGGAGSRLRAVSRGCGGGAAGLSRASSARR